MALSKYRVGDLIDIIDERNSFGITNFCGININKEFMPTAANTDGLDERKYKVVRRNRFVFSGMQTGRDQCIRISMYANDEPIIVSPAYTTFEIKRPDLVIPCYFFMFFKSSEKDRLGAFYSDGSIRSNLDWDRFCDIEIVLPDLSTQEKFVKIYLSMLENQKNYERGLEDLKLVCDSLIYTFKCNYSRISIGDVFIEKDERNNNSFIKNIMGINIDKNFMPTAADTFNLEISNYKIVKPGEFAFSGMQTGRDESIRIALNNSGQDIIISPAYTVLFNKNDKVLNKYIMLWFLRKEVDRLGWFMSDSSIRSNLDMDRFYEINFPIPPLDIQKSIVNIYEILVQRKQINEKLKQQMKYICPILIKGSIEEAKEA